MDASQHKHYHLHEFDARLFLDTYISVNTDKTMLEELILYPMKSLHKTFASGHIKGDTLIDFSVGPVLYHLFPICEFFNDITILEPNDNCIKEIESWLENKTDAFDWSHTSKFITELEGNKDQWQEKEEKLRKCIKRILKWDFTKENPTDPLKLQNADCLLIKWALDALSKDEDEWRKNVKKLSSMLKIGGYLILFGVFGARHYSVGEHKYHGLAYNEDFLRSTIKDLGYTIKYFEALKSKNVNDTVQYEQLVFITAVKEMEVC